MVDPESAGNETVSGKLRLCLAASAALHGLLLTTPLGAQYAPRGVVSSEKRLDARVAIQSLPQSATSLAEKPAPPQAMAETARPETPPNPPNGPGASETFSPGQVDRAAGAIDIPDLPPPGSVPVTASGKMVVKVFVDALGHAERIETVATSLPDDLVEKIQDALARARFAPATRNGEAVRSWTLIEFVYAEEPALQG